MAHINIANKRIEQKGRWLFWTIFATTMPILTVIGISIGIYFDYKDRLALYPDLLARYNAGEYYPKPTYPSFPGWQISLAIGMGLFVAAVSFLIMIFNRNKNLYGDKDAIIFNEGRRLFSIATKEGRVTAFLSDIVKVEVIDSVTPTPKKNEQIVEPTYGRIKFYMNGRKGPYEIITVRISGVNFVMENIDKIRFPKKYSKEEAFNPDNFAKVE
ncbi:MAG: hypothetical protein II467_00015 [Bacilli bacterium]|nr:hypothetical protein [Bacilli bacterium]